ncbi:glycosyltransferase [Halobacillus litoralis]|uniref:glycosyltransferase n=1 Tax=Halobacillus litoralis TaxID=45668 RepID=UPI001CD48EDF|nr:glycosyltransferase [Halobacillus litoralis]MCA1021063.1 glycosyltransferase [Halobacillus litoralis]
MDQRKIVVMYTFSPFPFGVAASNRIFSLALSIQEAGYKVIVLCNGGERNSDYNKEKESFIYENIEYRSFSIPKAGKFKRTLHRLNILGIINKHLTQNERKRVSFLYATHKNYNIILHFTLKTIMNIPSVVDVTEWHNSNQFKMGKLSLKYLLHNFRNKHIIPRAKNVICITSYLENHFYRKGCNTVIIPPQVTFRKFKTHKNPSVSPIRLFYAGTVAKKDYVDVILDGLCLLTEEELKKVQFSIVGLSEVEFKEQFPKAAEYKQVLGGSLEIVNRVPKVELENMLSESHFLVLMRPNMRYSNAGFPSKVPEALAAGVPIITNLTSDLKKYIREGHNGFIVNNFSAEAVMRSIQRAIKVKDLEFNEMSKAAVETAEKHFDYNVHSNDLKTFFYKSRR